MMIKTLFTAALFAASAGKIIVGGRFVICPVHAAIEIPHLFNKRVENLLVSRENRREDAHALLQDRAEIISQASWSSSSL